MAKPLPIGMRVAADNVSCLSKRGQLPNRMLIFHGFNCSHGWLIVRATGGLTGRTHIIGKLKVMPMASSSGALIL